LSRFKLSFNWALVFLWMGVIFYFSSQEGLISHQKSFSLTVAVEKVIEMITGEDVVNTQNRQEFEFIIRKIAHITEYFILSFLFFRAFINTNKNFKLSFILTAVFSIIYASTDEVHQIFVAGRGPSPVDVMIDSIGIFGYLMMKKFLYKNRLPVIS